MDRKRPRENAIEDETEAVKLMVAQAQNKSLAQNLFRYKREIAALEDRIADATKKNVGMYGVLSAVQSAFAEVSSHSDGGRTRRRTCYDAWISGTDSGAQSCITELFAIADHGPDLVCVRPPMQFSADLSDAVDALPAGFVDAAAKARLSIDRDASSSSYSHLPIIHLNAASNDGRGDVVMGGTSSSSSSATPAGAGPSQTSNVAGEDGGINLLDVVPDTPLLEVSSDALKEHLRFLGRIGKAVLEVFGKHAIGSASAGSDTQAAANLNSQAALQARHREAAGQVAALRSQLAARISSIETQKASIARLESEASRAVRTIERLRVELPDDVTDELLRKLGYAGPGEAGSSGAAGAGSASVDDSASMAIDAQQAQQPGASDGGGAGSSLKPPGLSLLRTESSSSVASSAGAASPAAGAHSRTAASASSAAAASAGASSSAPPSVDASQSQSQQQQQLDAEQRQQYEDRIASLSSDIEALKVKLEEAESACEEAKAIGEALQRTAEEERSRADGLARQLVDTKAGITTEAAVRSHSLYLDATTKWGAAEGRAATLDRQVISLQAEVGRLSEDVKRERGTVTELMHAVDVNDKAARKAYQDRFTALQAEVRRVGEERDAAVGKQHAAQGEASLVAQYKATLDEQNRYIADVKSQLAGMMKVIAARTQEVASLDPASLTPSAAASLREEAESSLAMYTDMASSWEAKDGDVKRLQEALQAATGEVAKATAAASKAMSDRAAVLHELQSRKAAADEADAAARSYASLIQQRDGMVGEWRDRCGAAEERCGRLERELTALERRLSAVPTGAGAASSSSAAQPWTDLVRDLQAQAAALSTRIAAATAAIDTAVAGEASARHSLQAAHEEASKLQSKLNRKEEKIKSLREERDTAVAKATAAAAASAAAPSGEGGGDDAAGSGAGSASAPATPHHGMATPLARPGGGGGAGGAASSGRDLIEIMHLRKIFKCPVCNERQRDCVINKCHHTFCKTCVEGRIKARSRKCPSCNTVFADNQVEPIYFA